MCNNFTVKWKKDIRKKKREEDERFFSMVRTAQQEILNNFKI